MYISNGADLYFGVIKLNEDTGLHSHDPIFGRYDQTRFVRNVFEEWARGHHETLRTMDIRLFSYRKTIRY